MLALSRDVILDNWIDCVRDQQFLNESVNPTVVFDFLGNYDQRHRNLKSADGEEIVKYASIHGTPALRNVSPLLKVNRFLYTNFFFTFRLRSKMFEIKEIPFDSKSLFLF